MCLKRIPAFPDNHPPLVSSESCPHSCSQLTSFSALKMVLDKHGSAWHEQLGFRPTAFPFEGFFWVIFSKELFKTSIIGLAQNPLRFFLHPREGSVHHIMVSVCRTVVLTSSRRPCAVWRGTNAVALGAAEQFCRDGDRGGGIGHVAPSEVSWRMRARTMGWRRQSDAVHGKTGTGQ